MSVSGELTLPSPTRISFDKKKKPNQTTKVSPAIGGTTLLAQAGVGNGNGFAA